MEYDLATFRTDLARLGFDGPEPPTPAIVRMRRSRLAKTRGLDQEAITAAYERLLAWAVRFDQRQMEPPPEHPKPAEAEPAKAAVEDPQLVQWGAALAGQRQRHDRRRGAYAKLRPAQPSG